MRTISAEKVTEVVRRLCINANCHLPQDVKDRIEQFHDARVCKLATKHFLEGTANIYAKVFEGMMEKGLLKKSDPGMLAFSFTPPISALIHLCDREPDRHDEAIERMEAFVRHFIAIHAVK